MVKLDILTWESKSTASKKKTDTSTAPQHCLAQSWNCCSQWLWEGVLQKLRWWFAVAAYRFHPSWLSSLVKYPNFCYIRLSNDWFSKPTKNLAIDLLMESASSVDTAVLALCVGLVFRPRNCHFISVQDCLLCISHISVFYVPVHIAVDVAFILDGIKIIPSENYNRFYIRRC